MNLYIRTFGCQMNVHDSQRISELMEKHGYAIVSDSRQADVILINTCTVREKAWHKAVSQVGRMCVLKRRRPELVLAAIGCVAQEEGDKWFERMPELDLVVGPDHYARLPELVAEAREGSGPRSIVGFDKGLPENFLTTGRDSHKDRRHPISYLTVMKGCSERCAYCIVPSVRGPERSRPAHDIVSEAEILVGDGVREIMLLGQKVNSYSNDDLTFAGLLERLDRIPGLERIRFTSPHPRHMDSDLIEAYGRLGTLCESIHIPVQSGSDSVLSRMGRRYTADSYREIARALREACPQILISTDLIIGFPGETEADFMQTIQLLEDVRFAGVFSFKYSPRPGTKAARRFQDDVPDEEKRRRLAAAHEVIERLEQEARSAQVGKKLEVLVEGAGRNEGQLTGRARNSQIVNFLAANNATLEQMIGQFVNVEVVRALPHSLQGNLVEGE